MKGIVSGSYPRSIINQAIDCIEPKAATDISFTTGDAITDDSFDFNLQTISSIATIIGTALSAIKLTISIISRHSKRNEPINNKIEEEINVKAKGLSRSRDFRIATHVKTISPQQFEITTEVSSKIHLEQLEVISNVSIDKKQFDVKINPLKRGN
jgi:hypothetical protein